VMHAPLSQFGLMVQQDIDCVLLVHRSTIDRVPGAKDIPYKSLIFTCPPADANRAQGF
jgi:hypothetical protein